MKIALHLACATAVAAALSGGALAGTPLVVQMDQSQLMMLTADPGSIIVGNPSIADVSLNGRQLFIHGHSFGETNLMIFDQAGKKIGDYEVTVSFDTANQLSLFKGGGEKAIASRYTYSCAPNCEQNMMVGDDPGYTQTIITNNRSKLSYATSTRSDDAGGSDGSGGGGGVPAPAASAPPQ
jgi:hypothetical protein